MLPKGANDLSDPDGQASAILPEPAMGGPDTVAHVATDMIRGSLWTLVAVLSGIPIAFAVNLVLARTLGPVGLGTLATFSAVVAVASTVLNLGISQATVQWIAEERHMVVQPNRLHLIRNSVGYHSFIEGPILAVTAYLLLRHDAHWEWALAAVAILVTQVLGTSSVLLTATVRNATAAQLAIIGSLVLQSGTVVAALVTRSAATVFAIQLAAGALGPALCFAVLAPADRKGFLRPLLLRNLPKGFMKYGLSASGAALVGMLVFGRSEVFVLKLHHLAVATGIFTLATGLAGQITVPMDSVMGPFLPSAAGLLAQNPGRTEATATRSLRVTSVLGALTMATALPATYFIIPDLFGASFDRTQAPFLLLGMISCLQSVTVPVSMLVLATRNASAVLKVNLACVFIDAGLALGLIPYLGLWGAVAANATAQSTSLVLLVIVLVRRVRVSRDAVLAAMLPIIIGMAAAGASVALVRPAGLPIVAATFLSSLVGGAIVALVLRSVPSWRIGQPDSALVERNLPRALRPLYRFTCRLLSLVKLADSVPT